MLLSLMQTELIKYKRTMIRWMIGIGGFLTAGTAYLFLTTENSQMSWELLASKGLNFINLLALLLVAVFTGYTFIGEYHESTISILFTYPVSRFKLYISKCLVILLLVISLYLTFFLATLFFGFINMGELPSKEFLEKFIKLTLLISVVNFVMVPVTAFVSLIFKGIGTYLMLGIGYFISYISFISSEHSLFIPTCIPDKLVTNYLISEYISKGDFKGMITVLAVTFLSAFVIGAVCYYKSDVYE